MYYSYYFYEYRAVSLLPPIRLVTILVLLLLLLTLVQKSPPHTCMLRNLQNHHEVSFIPMKLACPMIYSDENTIFPFLNTMKSHYFNYGSEIHSLIITIVYLTVDLSHPICYLSHHFLFNPYRFLIPFIVIITLSLNHYLNDFHQLLSVSGMLVKSLYC